MNNENNNINKCNEPINQIENKEPEYNKRERVYKRESAAIDNDIIIK